MPEITASRRDLRFVLNQDADLRDEEMNGKTYLVVPTISLVEGVVRGATAENPELALMEEHERILPAWNGRSVTTGHPKDETDNYTLVGEDPETYEEITIGTTFNASIEGKKLKMELWIDRDEAAKTTEGISALSRIEKRERVEVSTGFLAYLEPARGEYNGESYVGIERGIVPDHMAILASDEEGACNWLDGCGAGRMNQAGFKGGNKTILEEKMEIEINGEMTDQDIDELSGVLSVPEANQSFFKKLVRNLFKSNGTACSCTAPEGEKVMEELIDKVINSNSNGFTEADSEFLKTMSEENLNKLVVEEAPEKTPEEKAKEAKESEEAKAKAKETAPNADGKGNVNVETDEAKEARRITEQGSYENQYTIETFIEKAPKEIAEVLTESMRIHTQKREDTVKSIKANRFNQFTDEEIKGADMQTLERWEKMLADAAESVVDLTPLARRGSAANEGGEKDEDYGNGVESLSSRVVKLHKSA